MLCWPAVRSQQPHPLRWVQANGLLTHSNSWLLVLLHATVVCWQCCIGTGSCGGHTLFLAGRASLFHLALRMAGSADRGGTSCVLCCALAALAQPGPTGEMACSIVLLPVLLPLAVTTFDAAWCVKPALSQQHCECWMWHVSSITVQLGPALSASSALARCRQSLCWQPHIHRAFKAAVPLTGRLTTLSVPGTVSASLRRSYSIHCYTHLPLSVTTLRHDVHPFTWHLGSGLPSESSDCLCIAQSLKQ